jgi:hypothetical protein
MPNTGTAVTLNVKGSWYSRIQSTLPMLMDESVVRLDLQVDANFDWGKDEFEPPADGAEAPAGGFPLAQRIGPGAQDGLTANAQSITPAPILGVGAKLGANTASVNPTNAPLAPTAEQLGSGAHKVAVPGHAVSPGFPAPQATDSGSSVTAAASSGPIKASPILPVVGASSAKADVKATTGDAGANGDTSQGDSAQAAEDPSVKRGSLLPIRLAGQQGARANQANAVQGFVPLGVTTTETP